ncbi:MAG: hypothetical protein H6Q59_1535 [Firmicutes bacterium]|nr:hypothetical protein [Bacillota bacterium]
MCTYHTAATLVLFLQILIYIHDNRKFAKCTFYCIIPDSAKINSDISGLTKNDQNLMTGSSWL